MVMECLRCWWNGSSPVAVFFDVADLHRHNRISHALFEYQLQEIIAAPWIAVGFSYQASFTETGDLVLASPRSSPDAESSTGFDPVRETVSLEPATPQRTLWA